MPLQSDVRNPDQQVSLQPTQWWVSQVASLGTPGAFQGHCCGFSFNCRWAHGSIRHLNCEPGPPQTKSLALLLCTRPDPRPDLRRCTRSASATARVCQTWRIARPDVQRPPSSIRWPRSSSSVRCRSCRCDGGMGLRRAHRVRMRQPKLCLFGRKRQVTPISCRHAFGAPAPEFEALRVKFVNLKAPLAERGSNWQTK